jgi:hypothetical protein
MWATSYGKKDYIVSEHNTLEERVSITVRVLNEYNNHNIKDVRIYWIEGEVNVI